MSDFFKVVDASSGVRRSIAVGDTSFSLDYPIGKWVEAKVGGILVFNSLEDAQHFAIRFMGWELWSCDVGKEIELPFTRMSVLYGKTRLALEALWNYYPKIKDMPESSYPWPSGSVAFDKIKLTDLIETDFSVRAA